MRRLAALSLVIVLASCASRADRLTDALEKRGVPPKQARCMGERLSGRLDNDQLTRLKQLSALKRSDGRQPTLDDVLDQLRLDGDPKLAAAVVKAGLHCLI